MCACVCVCVPSHTVKYLINVLVWKSFCVLYANKQRDHTKSHTFAKIELKIVNGEP